VGPHYVIDPRRNRERCANDRKKQATAKTNMTPEAPAFLLVTLEILEIAIAVNQRLGQLADDMRANTRGLRDAIDQPTMHA
jgi:hypothetical protein